MTYGAVLVTRLQPGASSPAVLDADLAHAITLSLSSIHERARLLGPTLETRCSVTPQMFLTAIRLVLSVIHRVGFVIYSLHSISTAGCTAH